MSEREVIVKFGDRKHSGFCLGCGTLLMYPFNDFQCCPPCTESIRKAQVETMHRTKKYTKKGKRMPKTRASVVVHKGNVLRQVEPMGVPVE